MPFCNAASITALVLSDARNTGENLILSVLIWGGKAPVSRYGSRTVEFQKTLASLDG